MAQGRKETLSVQALQIVDALLILVAFIIASAVRVPVKEFLIQIGVVGRAGTGGEGGGLNDLQLVLYVIIPLTPIALDWFGFYRHPLRKRMSESLWQMVQSLVVVAMAVGVVLIVFKGGVQSRLILGSAVPLAVLLILAREVAVRSIVLRTARADDGKEAVIYVGSQESMKKFEASLAPETRAEYKVVAHFEPAKGSPNEFAELLKRESVGRVVFAPRHTEFGDLAELVEICEVQGVEVWISADFLRTQVARPDFDVMGGKPMLVLRSTPELSLALWIKWLMDFVISSLALAFSLVFIWWWAAILIKIGSPKGPVFFRQKRAGRYGKPFTMWKFRTMHPDAEARLDVIKEEQGNEMSGPVFKLENDPRVFPFGRFLRRTSIDELPQLLNILRGHMSLVGPRPLPLYEVEQFAKSEHRRRLSVKPGITCLWQVGGRNAITSFEEWVRLDLEYIDNWSLWLDIRILLKTMPAVILGKGSK